MKLPPGHARCLRVLLALYFSATPLLQAQEPSPTPPVDTDADGVPDKHDGWPEHKQLKTPPVPDSQYVVMDFGPGVALGLNKHGEVVGYGENNRGEMEAAWWRLNKPRKYLKFLTTDQTIFRQSLATAINDDGVITGKSTFTWDPNVQGEYPDPPTYPLILTGNEGHSGVHAFRYDHGVMTDMNDLSFNTPGNANHPSGANKLGSSGSAINRFGTIVGSSNGGLSVQNIGWYWLIVSDFLHPISFTGGQPTDLNVTPAPNSEFASYSDAVGINDSGAIAGYGAGDGRSAFFLSSGVLQLIDPGYSPEGFPYFASATGLNNLDHVVGNFGAYGGTSLWVNDPALAAAERVVDLGAIARTAGFLYSGAAGINDDDQIVGNATSASAGTEAVLWQNAEIIRLNQRVASNPNLYLQSAVGINKRGMIAANTSSGHVVLLLPLQIISDLNNNGKIDTTDSRLKADGAKPDATDEAREKAIEYLFVDDKISNGLWDKDDPNAPEGTTDDDDVQELKIVCDATRGAIWFEHPIINKLSFYKTRACNVEDKVTFPFVLSETTQLPEKLYLRAEEVTVRWRVT